MIETRFLETFQCSPYTQNKEIEKVSKEDINNTAEK